MARKLKLSGSTKAVLRKNNPPQGPKPRHWKQVWPYLKYGSIDLPHMPYIGRDSNPIEENKETNAIGI